MIKIIEDAMEGEVYENDKQILHGMEWKSIDRQNPHLNILVRKYDESVDKCKLFR